MITRNRLVVVLLLLLVCLLLAAGFMLRRQQPASLPLPTVISWEAHTSLLTYTDTTGVTQSLTIQPLRPGIIVPKNDPGLPGEEALVVSQKSQYWSTAFCPGDTLELSYTDDGGIHTIRNKGPRQCD